ncbi:MAG TPA: tetratricopeptide repeat protein [Terriglobales bacterium]|nr:tetratricopeptide repeat protein [Terriglobales bacterium]
MSDTAKHLEKAEKLLQRGKLSQALGEFQAILEEDPDNDSIRQRAVDVCLSLNQPNEAINLQAELFDRQVSSGHVAEAINSYKRLLRMGGATHARTLQYAELLEASDPREAMETYSVVANELIGAGKKQEALEAIRRAVTLDPSAENLRREGELAAQLGEEAEAAIAFLLLGQLEERNGRHGDSWFQRAYKLNPNDPEIAQAVGMMLLNRGDHEGARAALKQFADYPDAPRELRQMYVEALLGERRLEEAEPIVWALYEQDSQAGMPLVGRLLSEYLDQKKDRQAVALTRRLEESVHSAGSVREFLAMVREITQKHPPGVEYLEYMVELYNSANREPEYCEALLRLFELHFAARNYGKAAECLDRAAEVDAYEPGHERRLELLRGKIDANRFNAIANRLAVAAKASKPIEEDSSEAEPPPPPTEQEPTVIEDLMLQAEIFLQYSMRSRAMERLERINKLFPREEETREKLRQLYMTAGFVPKYESQAVLAGTNGAPPAPTGGADENAVDNFARVTEITRNISRQGSVKAVLFTAVNDAGRHWNVSRCVAGLCSPGKPPSAAIEYCAPGVKQSEVMALVKLISTLQALAVKHKGSVAIVDADSAAELEPIRNFVSALTIQSLMAVPLIDGNEHVGILILEQCDAQRTWRTVDDVVLKTVAEQIVMAVNNAKLRSLVKTLAVTDEKSGLLKRSSYLDVLLSEVRRGLQQSSPVTVILLNIGSAGALVKEIGEPAVESVMQEVGQVVTGHLRQNDVPVRYDLTTIALIVTDTSEKTAFLILDKLRKVLAPVKLPNGESVVVNAGIAEAVMQPRFDAVDIVTEAINRVEDALELARHEGENKAHALSANLDTADMSA